MKHNNDPHSLGEFAVPLQLGEGGPASRIEVNDNNVDFLTSARAPMPSQAVDPATVALFVSIGASLANFVGTLIGGKTGDALTALSGSLNNLNFKMQQIGVQMDAIVAGINETISSLDKSKLSQIAATHSQLLAYKQSFPAGVPQNADLNNLNYVMSNQNTADALFYFQGLKRGVFSFMPTLCHVTNTRLEVAATTWPCWYAAQHPSQPQFSLEVNTSAGMLSSQIAMAKSNISKYVVLKPIKGKEDTGGDKPPIQQVTIGWQVVDTEINKVVFKNVDPDNVESAFKKASAFRSNYVGPKQTAVLSNYSATFNHWSNMVGARAAAGIQNALKLGDAKTFLRFVSPVNLVMEDPGAVNGIDTGSVVPYRPLPMRDVLLDMLTSKPFRDRHGLLTKKPDRKSVKFWFEKAFHREPSPGELTSLMSVVEIFGFDSLFGCIAYSKEYEQRYGDGLPVAIAPVEVDTTLLAGTAKSRE